MYAWKFKDKNILLASGVNSKSQILYVRDPRKRVAKVAPWLTLDGDPYPVVVGGQIEWMVDGYTTTSGYPYSEQQSLGSATKTSLTTTSTSVAAQQNTQDQLHPQLGEGDRRRLHRQGHALRLEPAERPGSGARDLGEGVPGRGQPQSAMPAGLVPHLRYPEDLFKVQRQLLAHYHVTDPHAFYNGTEFWNVPNDPTVSGSVPQPAYYFTMTPDGTPTDGLAASVLADVAAGLAEPAQPDGVPSVDSQPGPNYGKFTLLTVPADRVTDGPQQVQNDIESTTNVSRQLSLLRQGGSRVVARQPAVGARGRRLPVRRAGVRAVGWDRLLPGAAAASSLRATGSCPTNRRWSQALDGVFGVKSSTPSSGSSSSTSPPTVRHGQRDRHSQGEPCPEAGDRGGATG